jgi:transmembrane sensor
MSRKVFHDLLQRYLDGSCTNEEKKLVEKWYMMLNKENTPVINPFELHLLEDEMWNEITSRTREINIDLRADSSIRFSWKTKIGVAAAVVTIMLFSTYFLLTDKESEISFLKNETGISKIEKINNSSLPLAVFLEDGSEVVLKPKASIIYPKKFSSKNRDVVLNGEAFFKVCKDKSRPFHVFHNQLKTTVVGTSFIIKSDKRDLLNEVVVLSGKVIVSEYETNKSLYNKLFSEKPAEVVLTRNQRAIYDKKNKGLVKTLVMKPLVIQEDIRRRSSFNFNETSLTKVFEELEEAYSIEIVVEIPLVKENTFTGELDTENLYTNLDLICKAIDADYEIKDTRIYIIQTKM